MSRRELGGGVFQSTNNKIEMPPKGMGKYPINNISPEALKRIIEQAKSGKSNIKIVEIPVIEGKTKSAKTNGVKAKKAPANDGMDMTH